MLPFASKKKEITNYYLHKVREYVNEFCTPVQKKEKLVGAGKADATYGSGGIMFSLRDKDDSMPMSGGVRFSDRDTYDSETIRSIMSGSMRGLGNADMYGMLSGAVNMSFVEKVNQTIIKNNYRDSSVYKAAQIDRRLYSKMMSDVHYKPSKDTAIAMAFALHMSLEEAVDLLERAGYTLSHSVAREVALEYFFKSNIYDLDIINDVLYQMGEKPIGRN